ncbi:MAG: hypothetical protein DID92_2727744266 [Candidatus Nitrotoga sp. SPKER]|nr:MAG: hypothetical protein DID92_2727744266 [Candidatus Nitrotoga sp. SPKER]
MGALTLKLEKVIPTLEWGRIDEFIRLTLCGIGRPLRDRVALASTFGVKTVLGLTATGLIERLAVDQVLKRNCGFSIWNRLPDESIFSRAYYSMHYGNTVKTWDKSR